MQNNHSSCPENQLTQDFYLGLLLACFIYWFYLLFSSQMDIVQDAIGYERLGKLIADQGWIAFLKQGPSREPLYPFLISISMQVAKIFGISYFYIQKFIQIVLLFTTQLMIYKVLCSVKVHKIIVGLMLFYVGFSPALVNSAFSLYSEIATYPLILGIMMVYVAAWRGMEIAPGRNLLLGILTGILFALTTLTKGIYQPIFLFTLIPFAIRSLVFLTQKRFKLFLHGIFFMILTALVYNSSLIPYKRLNQQYNGIYTICDARGGYALYGSAARRVEPLNTERLLTAIAYIPGEGFCKSLFGDEACYFWGIENLDRLAGHKLWLLRHEFPTDKLDQAMLTASKEKILEHPVQFFLMMKIDALKMFFWETTKIGFVTYPDWLKEIFDHTLFKNVLRLIVSLVTLFSYISLWIVTIKNFRIAVQPLHPHALFFQTAFFTLLITTGHVGFYALFDTIPRFALPVAPLYLITIALNFQYFLFDRKYYKVGP